MTTNISSDEDWRQLSDENAQLRDQLSQYNHRSEENVVLRNELSRHHQQSKDKSAGHEQIARDSQQSSQKSASSNTTFENHQAASSKNVESKQVVSQNPQETDDDAVLRAEVSQYRERHAELLESYEKLNQEMKRKKIESFEDLAEYDKESMKALIELARLTQPIQMEGNNIGLFGSTSTGKSTMLNALIGQNLAQTGVGETTTKITPYQGTNLTLWDVPGRNDEVSYLSMEYISFFKGLSRRLILIQATVKENSSMMKLLDEIELPYAIVLNKFDKVDQEEQAEMQKQIRSEVKQIGLKGVENVFFVSAKHPKMFSDWISMTAYLQNPSV